ncbi:MAG: TatD family hydrolase [Akkermansiaceae bacterium]|nr:TatD family hydrolase [Akkermansiaceae bacterium]
MQDAHSHLQDPRLDGIRNNIIKTMVERGVSRCVVNGTSPKDWQLVADLAKAYPELIIPSFGLHPWQDPSPQWFRQLTSYLDNVPHACVGECGLDRWVENYDIKIQEDVFVSQLELATKRNLPLSIHCLKAWGLMLEILESKALPERGFLLHSYSGSAELVTRLASLGAYFSFSGYFLHERKQNLRDTFKIIPPERILIETDAPDMLPPESCIEHRLKLELNHPANINKITTEASRTINTSRIHDNFVRFFELGF